MKTPAPSMTSCASCSPTRWSRRTRRSGSTPACIGLRHRWPVAGHYYVDFKTGKLTKSKSSYEHPQPHACFIQGVEDDLVNDGGIMDLWVREARLFKYGSGTGSNFSKLRGEGEKLSGGGRSSGLMSFLKIGDRAAARSSPAARRAAPPRWWCRHRPSGHRGLHRLEGEGGAEGRGAGRGLQARPQAHDRHHEGLHQLRWPGDACFDPERNPALKKEIKLARRVMIPRQLHQARHPVREAGYKEISFDVYDTDWDSDAYLTVSGQNSNNSVSLKDDFLRAVETTPTGS